MMLVEQGKLRLDDAASQYLPALKGREVIATFNEKDGTYTTRPAKQEMTIRHLLAHTSGFGYGFANQTVTILQQKAKLNPCDMQLLFDPARSGNTRTARQYSVTLSKKSRGNRSKNIIKPTSFARSA